MNRSIVKLIVVLVALLALYLIIHSARDVKSRPEPFIKADSSAVDGITISGKQGKVILKKRGNDWLLTEPVEYPAESRFVYELVGKLCAMTIEAKTTDNPEKQAYFQVDTSGVEFTITQGEKTVGRFIIGKMSDSRRHTYCRRVDENSIYLVPGNFTGHTSRKPKDWRNKIIMELPKETLARLDFTYPNSSYSLVLEDTVWTIQEGGKLALADKKIVDRILNALGRFHTYEFLDGDSARMVDFTQPELFLTVTDINGEKTELALRPLESDTEKYYLKKSGVDNTVFVIYKGSASALLQKVEDFKPKEIG
ncbi:MAG: DUF4340 domain-containing protein [bacterium]